MGGLFLYIFLIGIIRKTWLVSALYRTFYRDKNLHNFDKTCKIEYSGRKLVWCCAGILVKRGTKKQTV